MDRKQIRLDCLRIAERDPAVSGTADLIQEAANCEAWVNAGTKTDAAIRLACLQTAAARRGARDPRNLQTIAEDLYKFCVDGLPAPVVEPEAAPETDKKPKKSGTPAQDAPPAGTSGRRGRRRAKA